MTDEEKKAIDDLFSLTHINGYINLYDLKKANIYTSDLKRWQNGVKVLLNLIEKQQAELKKKDKIIDEMAKVLADYKYEEIICMEVDCEHIELQNGGKCIGDKNCIKEYFKNKVGTEEK